MILVVGHSQHLKVWQVWQGEIKDEYEAKEDTGFEEGNHEVQTGNQDWGKYSELPVLPSKPIVYDDERLSKPGLEQGAGHPEEPDEGKVLVGCDAIWLRKPDLAVALSRDNTFRKSGWPECCSPALIEGSRFWVRRIVDIPSALEGGTKIRREQGCEKAKGDICTTQQEEPTKTKRKKKRRPKASMCWSTIEDTKKGVEEKKESLRTSGCDKFHVGEIRADYKEADKGSSPLRSAEDVREVGSRVDVNN